MSTEEQERSEEETEAERWRRSLGYEEKPMLSGGKRAGVRWTPWMGDWFNSWSPRNSNSNAEGYWDHWVDIAIMILRDPLTKIVRPGAHKAMVDSNIEPVDFYDGAGRELTDEELMARFRPDATQERTP